MGTGTFRLLGIDPGLQRTGWGIVDMAGQRLSYVAAGVITSTPSLDLAERLVQLYDGLCEILRIWTPDEAAVEETFVNKNPTSTLKLGMARGVLLLAPAKYGIPIAEYAPNQIKKTIVGAGHADKVQVQVMVRHLLPGSPVTKADAADALAIAICHGHFAATRVSMARIADRIGR